MLFNPEITVWLYQERVDMRKSIDGLSIVISSQMKLNPSNGEIYVFFNKGNDKLKLLYWERNGFCLWYKRLEKSKYKIPNNKSKLNYEQLRWLLDGLDINELQSYERLKYEKYY